VGVTLAAVLVGCITLKFEVLKGTSLPNPPVAPVKIYIREFPVDSKAAIIDSRAAPSSAQGGEQYMTNDMARQGGALATISRPSRIEDLSGAILRELGKERVRIFAQLEWIDVLDEETVREVDNPFQLVPPESEDADLEISGTALINSQRVRKEFSQVTQNVEIQVQVRDIKSGKVVQKSPLVAGISMTFNSRELEEAIAIAVVSSLTRKLLF
jgi:hypothetical protein